MKRYLNTLIVMKEAILARVHKGGVVDLLDEHKRFMGRYKHMGRGKFCRLDKTETFTQIQK